MWNKTKMTPEKIKELEWYFAKSFTDEEACLMADISRQTLNAYCQENERWREKKELLKRKPSLTAKINVVDEIIWRDINSSKWWLERKEKNEFSTKEIIDNNNVNVDITEELDEEQRKKIASRFK